MTPNNLPLRMSQLLSFPVTDYCANLVVLDDLTGTVKFAHSSVKDFLSDADKVPPELRHLSLVDEEDNMWCGRVCLAHAKLHSSRKQLEIVAFRPQEIDTNIASSIIKNIITTMSPIKLRTTPSRSQHKPFRMPLSAVSQRTVSSLADMHLHDYIRQHWLTHNMHIRKEHAHYTDFENLCLVHDSDIQPWSATTQTINVEHYRQMVMHAVFTNHGPLLRIVRTAVEAKGAKFHQEVFDRFAPGTDSTFLHCAAVLGHIDSIRILLEIPSYHGHLADGLWTSAAVAAMRAQQLDAFELLLSKRSSDRILPEWYLTIPKLEKDARYESGTTAIEERLLDLCAIEGSLPAARTLLSAYSVESFTDEALSSAFFLACKYGHQEIGQFFATCGAGIEISWTHKPREGSAASKSFELRDLKMTRTLLTIRRNIEMETYDINLTDILETCGYVHREFDALIKIFLEFEVDIISQPKDHSVLWWLEYLLVKTGYTGLTYHDVEHLIRLVLRSFHAKSMNSRAHKTHCGLPETIRPAVLVSWLKIGADDVLVQVINAGGIPCPILTSADYLSVAVERCSSRVLESSINFVSACKHCDDRRHPGANRRDRVLKTIAVVDALLENHYSETRYIGYVDSDARLGRASIVEFLLCSDFLHGGIWLSSGVARSEPNALRIVDAIRAYENDLQRPQYSLLMWIRCYSQMKGDVVAARELCYELHHMGADGNFALNFPRGYSRAPGSVSLEFPWRISPNIWLAVHGWSFRLNRARGMPYSDSDMWYMGGMLRLLGTRLECARWGVRFSLKRVRLDHPTAP